MPNHDHVKVRGTFSGISSSHMLGVKIVIDLIDCGETGGIVDVKPGGGFSIIS